ncbi:hypothetical protein ABT322_31195, partial [Streptomyces flaveolus]
LAALTRTVILIEALDHAEASIRTAEAATALNHAEAATVRVPARRSPASCPAFTAEARRP